METSFKEIFEIILRWAHVFAGIMWVGATYYFTWLDGRFVELEKKNENGENAEKYVWMVHSGGFYLVEKQKCPQMMGQTLHWFKWEAALTWITGILLFVQLYYHGAYMISYDENAISHTAMVWLSLGMIIGGWVVYDLLWKFCPCQKTGVIVSYLLIVTSSWVACKYLPGRGAYLQLGAMMGTIMAANVWMRILPAQRRMVNALKAGQEPDLAEGERAKNRSKHNSFIVVPVVFLMISNHYPSTYGSHYNWIIMSVVVVLGWIAAKVIRGA